MAREHPENGCSRREAQSRGEVATRSVLTSPARREPQLRTYLPGEGDKRSLKRGEGEFSKKGLESIGDRGLRKRREQHNNGEEEIYFRKSNPKYSTVEVSGEPRPSRDLP